MTKPNKFIFWAPRILLILFALFLGIFSFDVFDSCNGFFECVLGLFMHNLPSLILLVILAISWKHELVGAVIFIILGSICIIGIIVSLLLSPIEMINPILIIGSVVFFLIGILFFIGWKQKKKIRKKR
jgi:hypothetical protein